MTTPEPYDSDDDDLSEIDTTPEQFDAMMAEAEPAVLIDPPVRFRGNNFTYEPGLGIRVADMTGVSIANCRFIPKADS